MLFNISQWLSHSFNPWLNHLPLQEPNDDLPENLVILARVVINGARSEVLGLGVDGSNLDGAEKRRL